MAPRFPPIHRLQGRVLPMEKEMINPLQPRPAGGGRNDGP